MDKTIVMSVVSIFFSLLQGAFWFWVNSLVKNQALARQKIDEIETKLYEFQQEVYKSYQSKTDSHRDIERIENLCNDIKKELHNVSNKLDKKADKGS